MSDVLISQMADDEDFLPLLEMFVDELDDRIAAIRTQFDQSQGDRVRELAHQLKGAGGGYGYPQITEAAKALEDVLKADGPVAEVKAKIDQLDQVCQAAKRGMNQT